MGFSIKSVLDPRRSKSDGTYPIRIRVYINGKKVLYSTRYSLSKVDWLRLNDANTKDRSILRIKNKLENIIAEAKAILQEIDPLNHETFQNEFFRETQRKNYSVRFWFNEYVKELKGRNSAQSTIINYNTAINSLETFYPSLKFNDINIDFLKSYEIWMKSEGNSIATTSIYLRNLRTIFNYVIDEKKILKRDAYPFGRKRYVVKSKFQKKLALSFEQIKQLESYDCKENKNLAFGRDMWLFLYLLNGSNVKDICKLTYSNINLENKIFVFNRAKTEETESTVTPISGILNDKAVELIKKWANQEKKAYVFPFFKEFNGQKYIDPERELAIIKNLRRRINRNLKTIQEELKFPIKLTTAIARHSFASRLNEKFKKSEIQEQMGHTSSITTDNYINSLDFASKKEMSDFLL